MILQKEFYFIRHGQTDHNVSAGINKNDHPDDIPLNKTGRSQAQSIEPIIASLLIQIVCWMGIEEHAWAIDNCIPVHFAIGDHGKWKAKKLV